MLSSFIQKSSVQMELMALVKIPFSFPVPSFRFITKKESSPHYNYLQQTPLSLSTSLGKTYFRWWAALLVGQVKLWKCQVTELLEQ